jgi:hypothetical protein
MAVMAVKAKIAAVPADAGDSLFVEIPNFLSPAEIARYGALLDSTADWKAGEFTGGKTPRLQKWFQDDARYFSKHWNNQDLERWKSAPADDWLVELRTRIQAAIDKPHRTSKGFVWKSKKN